MPGVWVWSRSHPKGALDTLLVGQRCRQVRAREERPSLQGGLVRETSSGANADDLGDGAGYLPLPTLDDEVGSGLVRRGGEVERRRRGGRRCCGWRRRRRALRRSRATLWTRHTARRGHKRREFTKRKRCGFKQANSVPRGRHRVIHMSPSESVREKVVVIRVGLDFWSQKPEAKQSEAASTSQPRTNKHMLAEPPQPMTECVLPFWLLIGSSRLAAQQISIPRQAEGLREQRGAVQGPAAAHSAAAPALRQRAHPLRPASWLAAKQRAGGFSLVGHDAHAVESSAPPIPPRLKIFRDSLQKIKITALLRPATSDQPPPTLSAQHCHSHASSPSRNNT